jgi:hypothetical protein
MVLNDFPNNLQAKSILDQLNCLNAQDNPTNLDSQLEG